MKVKTVIFRGPFYVVYENVLTKVEFSSSSYSYDSEKDEINEKHLFTVKNKDDHREIRLDDTYSFYRSIEDYERKEYVEIFGVTEANWSDFFRTYLARKITKRFHASDGYFWTYKNGAEKIDITNATVVVFKDGEVTIGGRLGVNINKIYLSELDAAFFNYQHVTDEEGINRKVEGMGHKLMLTPKQKELTYAVMDAIKEAEEAGVMFVCDGTSENLCALNGESCDWSCGQTDQSDVQFCAISGNYKIMSLTHFYEDDYLKR